MMFPATSLPTSMLELASIPVEIRSEKAWRQVLVGVRLHTLEQCRIVKEFHPGEELSAPGPGETWGQRAQGEVRPENAEPGRSPSPAQRWMKG
jgi:hypothetical protein